MDDAHSQLENLHRQVFNLANQTRARSAVPWRSVQRMRMQKVLITEMEDEADLCRFDIDATGRQVKALTGRRQANRRQDANRMQRLRDADAIGVYARRQGLRILAEVNGQIDDLLERIRIRMLDVDGDDRMPRSKASQRRAHLLALLDNRLDKSRRWNNELRTQNAALRQDIDDLNLERRTDLSILSGLGESVVGQRIGIRSMLDGMRQAEIAQAAAIAEIAALEAQHRIEMQKFESDWTRTAELDEQHRVLEQEIIRMKGEMYFGDDTKSASDESIQLIMSRTAWRIAKDKALLAAASARHAQLYALIAQLQRLTGSVTVDQIVARFERADVDHLAQYTALQELIVELAQLERQNAPSGTLMTAPNGLVVPTVSAIGRVESGKLKELEIEASALHDVFKAMTEPIRSMMDDMRAIGCSRCSGATRERLAMVGVTAQNVETMVSALEDDIRLVFIQFGCSDGGPGPGSPTTRAPNDNPDDGVCITIPSSLYDDDETDIR